MLNDRSQVTKRSLRKRLRKKLQHRAHHCLMQWCKSKSRIQKLMFRSLRRRCITSWFPQRRSVMETTRVSKLSNSSIWKMLRRMSTKFKTRYSRLEQMTCEHRLKRYQQLESIKRLEWHQYQSRLTSNEPASRLSAISVSARTRSKSWQECMRHKQSSSSTRPLQRWTNCGFSTSVWSCKCVKKIKSKV